LVTPNREFERHFGGKTVLSGLRLKSRKIRQSNVRAASDRAVSEQQRQSSVRAASEQRQCCVEKHILGSVE
jgi:hypothetical protein